jgi:hypothetical protein
MFAFFFELELIPKFGIFWLCIHFLHLHMIIYRWYVCPEIGLQTCDVYFPDMCPCGSDPVMKSVSLEIPNAPCCWNTYQHFHSKSPSHVGQYTPWFAYGNHGEWDFYKAMWSSCMAPSMAPGGPRSQPLASPCHTLQRLREAQRLRARWSWMAGWSPRFSCGKPWVFNHH